MTLPKEITGSIGWESKVLALTTENAELKDKVAALELDLAEATAYDEQSHEEFMKANAELIQVLKDNHKVMVDAGTTALYSEIDKLQAQLKDYDWISVSDRLPEEGEMVLCLVNGGMGLNPRVRKRKNNPPKWYNEFDNSTMNVIQAEEDVTHWKTITPPASEKGKG